RHHKNGAHVLLIGHAGHPEVEGTMGQLPQGAMSLIETVEDAETFEPPVGQQLAFVTQTTLSVDDTTTIVEVLRRRFPEIWVPHKEDICYATTNRQHAVKVIAADADLLFVVGSPTSSNSLRLVEVGMRAGCPAGKLIEDVSAVDWDMVAKLAPRVVALTAGASAPESAVQGVVDGFQQRYATTVEEIETTREKVSFKLPRELV
ncbi:MAG: 4-hydroxy-3-methylbut-2-enyl diphosphate reductase, partial [Pseudomonadota bacterium]